MLATEACKNPVLAEHDLDWDGAHWEDECELCIEQSVSQGAFLVYYRCHCLYRIIGDLPQEKA